MAGGVEPSWNFFKYLVDGNGDVVEVWGPNVAVRDIVGAVHAALQDVQDPQVHMNIVRTYLLRTEAETPNNFCPSRFSQVCPEFTFLQNANLDLLYLALLTRKSRHTLCTDLRFGERKICTHWRKYRQTERGRPSWAI